MQTLWDAVIRETVVGVFALCALIIVLRYKPWKNGGTRRPEEFTSGEKSVEFWKNEIRLAVKEGVEEAFAARNAKLMEITKQSVKEVMQYFYGFRKGGDD